jgi:hypothetical protein
MKVARAATILVLGPLLGTLLGFSVGTFAIPPDPNFVANGSHGSPGDGFLIMGCAALGFVLSVFVSIALTWSVLRKPNCAGSKPNQLSTGCPLLSPFDPSKKRVLR